MVNILCRSHIQIDTIHRFNSASSFYLFLSLTLISIFFPLISLPLCFFPFLYIFTVSVLPFVEEFPQRPFNNSNFNEIICLAHNQPPFPPSFYIEIVKFHRQITTPFMVACTIILFHCELYGRFLITFVPINTIYSLLCINETMGAYSSFFFVVLLQRK